MNFSIPNIIKKKRDGEELTPAEIQFFIDSVVNRSIQDIQIGSMLMAIFLRSMTDEETVRLTHSITNSGHVFSWPDEWRHLVVDKHSTGGVGDKVSLPLVPALIACGLKVPMISGRGLSITGGTLDKLEAIPGFQVEMKEKDIQSLLSTVGGCIVGQTETLVPADKTLYAFRDVTETVESKALVTASILSKKLAEGISSLVLDVKYGSGSVFKTKEAATSLAKDMVCLGCKSGMTVSAVISSMDSPLGFSVGNALEVAEALECLQGKYIMDLNEAVEELGGELLYLTGKYSKQEGRDKIKSVLKDGSALEKFLEILTHQGVHPTTAKQLCIKDSNVLPRAPFITCLKAQVTGYVQSIDAFTFGKVAQELGAGRQKAGQVIDYSVGLQLLVQRGFHVTQGQNWVIVHHAQEVLSEDYINRLQMALIVSDQKVTKYSRITDLIRPSKFINNNTN